MIIQKIAQWLSLDDTKLKQGTAKTLDWIAAIAILAIGVLGFLGVIPMSGALSCALIGAGATYTFIMIISDGIDLNLGLRKKEKKGLNFFNFN